MDQDVLDFREIDDSMLMAVGGKGLNLAELSRLDGLRVPEGFCVTTAAYRKAVANNEQLAILLEQLAGLAADDQKMIAEISAKIRTAIEGAAIPGEIAERIIGRLSRLGGEKSYAVRSSATAEDLPLASFAGQHDTYLNVKGENAVLQHVVKCWASLFTDRAVNYRMLNGFDHRQVRLAVVIQRMVFPQASGILFTADPVTGHRKVVSIDASYGLGEAIVSGRVDSDIYKVQDARIIGKKIGTKRVLVSPLREGGTREKELEPERRNSQTLTDERILELFDLGKRIEAHYACPQDIEWCLSEDGYYVVQSRPITTLYPVPAVHDGKNHVFLSYGHAQMMTDAVKPLGRSFLAQLAGAAGVPVIEAGGRLFMDVAGDLASPRRRKLLLSTKNNAIIDDLGINALSKLVKRQDYLKTLARKTSIYRFPKGSLLMWIVNALKTMRKNDVSLIRAIKDRNDQLTRNLEQTVQGLSGDELFAFIIRDQKALFSIVYYPPCIGASMAAWMAANWLEKNIVKGLGDKNVLDSLVQYISNNITSETGLALLDVADVVRQYPAVTEYFHHAREESFLEDLSTLPGGAAVADSMRSYLGKFGMRCPGEIDITRPRWSEKPTQLIPAILSNVKNFEPRAHAEKFERGRLEVERKAQDILARLRRLPRGKQKARKAEKMISVLRNFSCLREYPKYFIMTRYQVYKEAMMREAAVLVERGLIKDKEDIFYLSLAELREAVRTNLLDYSVISRRKQEHEVHAKMRPPRVMTSDGEVITGEYSGAAIPKGALVGTPVASGIVEGRARVISRLEDADIEDGDILVTAFTDPGWTPLFVSIKGLVTEVGGLMTHGSVIAREYGLPTVVSVENATRLIKDGQRIRINGTQGYVETL